MHERAYRCHYDNTDGMFVRAGAGRVTRPMAKTAIISGAQPGDISRGRPPYPREEPEARLALQNRYSRISP
jgi:hypothetical protein